MINNKQNINNKLPWLQAKEMIPQINQEAEANIELEHIVSPK